MLLKMCDAAVPVKPPGFQVSAFYIGFPGATPHVATIEEWNKYGYSLRLPIFTPSWFHTGIWDATDDAAAALTALESLGVPPGVTCGLDFETQLNPPYVNQFNSLLALRTYKTLLYGSMENLFKNPKPSAGYWAANYNNGPVLTPGSIATQYTDKSAGNAYDSSVIDSSVPLWGAIRNETNLPIMHQVAPQGANDPGIFLLDGLLYAHIDSPETVAVHQAANIPLIQVDYAMYESVVATIAAFKGSSTSGTVTGTFTGAVA